MAQLLLGLSFSLGHVVPLALAGQMLFMAAFSIGVGPCAMMVASELFPLQIRGFGAPARAGCVAGQWRAEAAARRDGRAASGREDVARDAAPPPTLPQRPRRWGSAPAALTSPLDSLCALAWAPATARADSTRRCHAHQSRHLRHGRSLLPLPLARAHTRGRLLSLRSPRVVCHRVHATLRARDEGCALAACARETPRLFSSAPPILSVTPVHPCTPPPLPPPLPDALSFPSDARARVSTHPSAWPQASLSRRSSARSPSSTCPRKSSSRRPLGLRLSAGRRPHGAASPPRTQPTWSRRLRRPRWMRRWGTT